MTETIDKMAINRTAEIGIKMMSLICIFPIINILGSIVLSSTVQNVEIYFRYFISVIYFISLAGGIMYIYHSNLKNWIFMIPFICLTAVLGCILLFLPTVSPETILNIGFLFTGWTFLFFGISLPKKHPNRKTVIDVSFIVSLFAIPVSIFGWSFLAGLFLYLIAGVLMFSKFRYPCES